MTRFRSILSIQLDETCGQAADDEASLEDTVARDKAIKRASTTLVTIEYNDSLDVCSVCLTDFERGDALVRLSRCTHVYHKDCIMAWIATTRVGAVRSLSCPCCAEPMDHFDSNEIERDATGGDETNADEPPETLDIEARP